MHSAYLSFMGKLVVMPSTAPPKKITNLEKRAREHLFPHEVEAMVKAARIVGRHGLRDAIIILLAYRHGLRVSELVALRWEQVDLNSGVKLGKLSKRQTSPESL